MLVAGAILLFLSNVGGPEATASPSSDAPTGGLPTIASTIASSLDPGTAEPSSQSPESAVILAAGDVASCSTTGDSATAALLHDLEGTVVTLGDSVYPDGTASQFSDCYDPTWGQELSRTRPTPGNHDYQTANAKGYFGYFGAAAGDPVIGYYAYDLGAWRIYSLNSNCEEIGGCDPGSAQLDWLQADLAANPRQCVLAYWHFPRYSSGEHGSQASVDGLWDALYAAGADVVLSGHDHDYERFAPLSNDGKVDPDRGIVEFVAGTGGFSHYLFTNVLAASRARNNTAFGVLELTLGSGSWSSRFIPVADKSYTDDATGSCH